MQRLSKYFPFFVVGLVALLHLPFITADPDTQVSVVSRGAWTDEGLNTVQVRNFVNHGYLSMGECDNLIKTPFFGLVLVPFYSLFGAHIWIGRALVLSSILMVLFLFLRKKETRLFGTILAIVGLLQFHIFHYSHYSLAEMLGIACILLGIYLLWQSAHRQHWLWPIVSTTCFSLAYYTKVTFAYAILIPFMVRYMQFLSNRLRNRFHSRSLLADWSIQAAVTGFFAAVFYYKWYLPNKAVFSLVKQNQGTGRYDIADAWTRFSFNIEHFIVVDEITPFAILLPVAIIFLLFFEKLKSEKRVLLFALLSWSILETHHFLLINPPTRYLLPLFFAGLAVVSFALAEIGTSYFSRAALWLGLILLGGYNISNYHDSLQRRTYSIAKVRQYLSNHNLKNETILGVWSTTLAAETNARTLPVWEDFTSEKDLLNVYRPRIVLSEHNEAESGEAFKLNGINLLAESDSVKQFNLWRYKVNIFWITPTR